jgi:hypothetical protein
VTLRESAARAMRIVLRMATFFGFALVGPVVRSC